MSFTPSDRIIVADMSFTPSDRIIVADMSFTPSDRIVVVDMLSSIISSGVVDMLSSIISSGVVDRSPSIIPGRSIVVGQLPLTGPSRRVTAVRSAFMVAVALEATARDSDEAKETVSVEVVAEHLILQVLENGTAKHRRLRSMFKPSQIHSPQSRE